MAAGTLADFKIYEEQFYGGYIEALEQNANVFNGASNNAIVLSTESMKGQFEQEAFFKSISGLVSRRDVTSTAAAADNPLTAGEFVSVKLNRKIGPIANTMDSFRKISRDPRELSFILGEQIGQAVAIDYVNTLVAGTTAAIGGQASLVHDGTAGTVNHTALIDGMAKLGDASNRIVAFVMHSKQYFDLVKQAVADKIVEVAGVTIYTGNVATFNRPVIVTDSPDLITAGTPDTYHCLGLVENAVSVVESEEREILAEPVTGNENLMIRVQGEYAFNLRIRGFAWDITNGGANPADAAVATGANWTLAASDVKSAAGVMVNTQ